MEPFNVRSAQLGTTFNLDPIDHDPPTWRVFEHGSFLGYLQMPARGVFHAWNPDHRYLTTSEFGHTPALARLRAAANPGGPGTVF